MEFVKIIVPFPASGSADDIPRIIAEHLSRKWGQPVVVENLPGAAGNIGAAAAYRAAPDGYTLMSAPPPPLVINQNLYPKLPFEPEQFEPISMMVQVPNGLLVNPEKVKATNIPELIDELKRRPGDMTSATQGNGTTSHLTSEMFQMIAKVKMRQIPYRGSAPALQGLVAGDVRPDVRQSRCVAAAGRGRQTQAAGRGIWPKHIITADVAELGRDIAGVEVGGVDRRYRRRTPKTPKAIVDKINADVSEALRSTRYARTN